MSRTSVTTFRIRMISGQRPLAELLDELAREAVRKQAEEHRADSRRVKKMPLAGRAA